MILTDSRVTEIAYDGSPVRVRTESGFGHEFDLLIGSDGLQSVVRKTLFPDVTTRAPTNNAAYRAVLPYDEVYSKVPEAREFGSNSIDVWSIEKGYIITYPISAGREWNTVLSHFRDRVMTDVETDVDMQEVRDYYKNVDPNIRKVLDLVPNSKRWPLLITGPLKSWSSPQKNIVLMGDTAHSMVNHLAQCAATSMEDGAFLGRVLGEVVHSVLTLPEAIHVYEKTRMPRVWIKQQASFVKGAIYMADDVRRKARDRSSAALVAQTPAQSEVASLQSEPLVTGPDANARS